MKKSYQEGGNHPYYIVAPDYRESSAGVRVMHRLCHMLNTHGFEAYVVGAEVFDPELKTPRLEDKIAIRHKRENRMPIAVYPEIISGNPINAPVCVRYMLNKEGVIEGNPVKAGPEDLFFYYSRAFTPNTKERFYYLRLNTHDLDLFKPDPARKKGGPLLYLNRVPASAVDFSTLPNDIEVLSNRNPLSLHALAEKLQSTTVLYSFESSSTCSLAMLCGCPLVAMTLPGFDKYGFTEQSLSIYGGCGYALTDSEDALAAARESLPKFRKGALNLERAFLEELDVFVRKTQDRANEIALRVPDVAWRDALYQDWITTHRFQATDAREYEARVAQWVAPPRFHIALVHDGNAAPELARTLKSLGGQYYSGVFVTILSPLPAPDGLNTQRLEWMPCEDPWMAAKRALHGARSGSWLGLMRAGDLLAPHALLVLAEYLNSHPDLQAVYTDEDVVEADGRRHSPSFKPDFDLEWLRGNGYTGGLLLARDAIWQAAGGWLHYPDYEDEFDLALRLAEQVPANAFGHLADVLYHRSAGHPARIRAEAGDNPQLPHLQRHFARCAPETLAAPGLLAGTSRILHPVQATPRVSLLLPANGPLAHLQRCIESLFDQTEYPDFEVVIIGHADFDAATRGFLDGLRQLADSRLNVVLCAGSSSTSALINRGAETATGSVLLLLAPSVAALHRDWLGELIALLQLPNVGAVGARLLSADGSMQHGGYLLGLEGAAASPLAGHSADEGDALERNQLTHHVRAVSSACLMIHKELFLAVGGFDAERFPHAFADVDLCLKLGLQGQSVLWTPFATLLYSAESHQVSDSTSSAVAAFHDRWLPELIHDRAGNPNLSLRDTELEPEPEAALSWNPVPWNPRPRLLVHPVDRSGSGQYRILNPARAVHEAHLFRGHASQRFFGVVEIAKADMDTVVVQLPTTTRHLKALDAYRKHSGAFLIVEADDLITDIPPASPLYHIIGKTAQDCFHRSLRSADRLVVTTEALAAAFAGKCGEVVVSRNYLTAAQWADLKPARLQGRRKPRVGWAGSESHLGDLSLISEVVKAMAKEVDWVFFGACPPEMLPYIKETYAGVPFDEYPAKLAALGLDLAVAPLEANAFNEAKSSLKLLEYGILGYPVVCSNVGPYREGFPVKRVSNSAKAWIRAIRERIHDLDAARTEGLMLQDHVRRHWMLEDHLEEWLAAWTR